MQGQSAVPAFTRRERRGRRKKGKPQAILISWAIPALLFFPNSFRTPNNLSPGYNQFNLLNGRSRCFGGKKLVTVHVPTTVVLTGGQNHSLRSESSSSLQIHAQVCSGLPVFLKWSLLPDMLLNKMGKFKNKKQQVSEGYKFQFWTSILMHSISWENSKLFFSPSPLARNKIFPSVQFGIWFYLISL